MSLDKYQQAWKSEAAQVKVTFDTDLLSKEVWKSHESLRSLVFWRDVREVGGALMMIPVWFVLGSIISVPWTWWLTVPALLWIAGFMLLDRQRHPQRPSGPGEPLLFYVNESLTQVEHQIWLLRNVFWWYLLPLSISLMAFFLHVSWESSRNAWEFAIVAGGFSIFLIAVYGWIYRTNQRVVREQLEPRRQHLAKLVANLESDNDAADSDDIMELVSSLAATDHNAGLSPNWATWSENWNRNIPSWWMVAIIVVPTLIGAFCGYQFAFANFGPVFFQSVCAAVIPFQIMVFGRWYLTSRRHKGQPMTGTGKTRPGAPAIFMILMTLVISAFAFAAIFSFVGDVRSRQGYELLGSTPSTSPFTEVRFEGEQVIVTYDGAVYQWLEIDEIKVEYIVAAAKSRFGKKWQKRVAEDMPDVLLGMDCQLESTVRIRLLDRETKENRVFEKALMTQENRQAVCWNRAHADDEADAKFDDESASELPIDERLRARLVGRYQLTPDFIFDVQDRGGQLMVGITNQSTQQVYPDSATHWSYRGLDATIEFKLRKTGPATRLILHQNGIRQTAKRIAK